MSYNDGHATHYAAVFGGYIEVLAGRVIVLAESAERAEEIDVSRATAAKSAAEKALVTAGTPDDVAAAARIAVARAEIRIQIAGRATLAAAKTHEVAHAR